MSGAGGARSGVGDADVVGLHLAGVWLPTTLAPFARHSSGNVSLSSSSPLSLSVVAIFDVLIFKDRFR